ncbi:MAG: hypothetical protein R3F54_04315 [Alphaproteobacteria bacterium]
MNLSREGMFRICGGRAPTEQRIALGADRDGRLKALMHTGTTVKIEQNAMTEPFIEASQHMYRSEATLLEVSAEAEAPPPVEAESWSMHSYGAVFCEARVHAVTGKRIRDLPITLDKLLSY